LKFAFDFVLVGSGESEDWKQQSKDGVQLERLEIYKKNYFGLAAWLEGLLMTLIKANLSDH
jgi:hypothetical protein